MRYRLNLIAMRQRKLNALNAFVHLFIAGSLSVTSLGCASVDHAKKCDELLAQAKVASDRKDFSAAQDALEAAAKEAELSENLLQRPRVMQERARAYLAGGNFMTAERLARELLDSYDREDPSSMSRTRVNALRDDRDRAAMLLADVLIAESKREDAAAVLKTAMAINKQNTGAMMSYLALSTALKRVQSGSGEQSRDVNDDLESFGAWDALTLSGHKQIGEGNLVLVEDAYLKALKATENGAPNRICETYARLVESELLLGKLEETKLYARKALEMDKFYDKRYRGDCLLALGLLEEDQKKSKKILEDALREPGQGTQMLDDVIFLAPETMSKWPTHTLDTLWDLASGVVWQERMFDAWREYGKVNQSTRARAIAWFLARSKDPRLAQDALLPAECMEHAAFLLWMDGKRSEAIKLCKRAMPERIARTKSNLQKAFWTYRYLADDYMIEGQYESALQAIATGLKNDESNKPALYAKRAENLLAMDRLDDADAAVSKGLTYWVKHHPPRYAPRLELVRKMIAARRTALKAK